MSRLPSVSAAEAKLERRSVRLHPEIEPLVRLLENTSRERVLDEVALRIQRGTTYREVLAALQLAGVRPSSRGRLGSKFHAVLVVNSAHLASLSSPDSERWLPIFWAIDQFKSSQARDVQEGDWALAPVDEPAVRKSDKARQPSSTRWTTGTKRRRTQPSLGLARTAGANEIHEILCRYGVRDFSRDRAQRRFMGGQLSHAGSDSSGITRGAGVAFARVWLARIVSGDKGNPGRSRILPADRPFPPQCRTRETDSRRLAGRKAGRDGTKGIAARDPRGRPSVSELTVEGLNRQAWRRLSFRRVLFVGAGELLMQSPISVAALDLHERDALFLSARDE
ncbi:MAG: hypothetical protein IPK15_27325 [Verrucomicrobia bacterium]|nr:hypothetical protein [Verrucomicrobiota bacterium]